MTSGGRAGGTRSVRPRRGRDSGQSSVELALALPLVALLALLVVQVALVVRDEVLVQHASREAARAAVVSREPGVAARAARQAGPLTPGRLQVQVDRPGGADQAVAAHVRYRSVTEVPVVGWLLPDLDLEATTVMRDEDASGPAGALGEHRSEDGDGARLVERFVAVAALG